MTGPGGRGNKNKSSQLMFPRAWKDIFHTETNSNHRLDTRFEDKISNHLMHRNQQQKILNIFRIYNRDYNSVIDLILTRYGELVLFVNFILRSSRG